MEPKCPGVINGSANDHFKRIIHGHKIDSVIQWGIILLTYHAIVDPIAPNNLGTHFPNNASEQTPDQF
jgi:hypothetical protein